MREAAAAAAERLARALEAEEFRGWDPFDALASPLLRSVCRTPRARQAAIQALKRSPLNLRPVLGVPSIQHTKALALLASAYAQLAQPELAVRLADLLLEKAVRVGAGLGWGYDFDVQTRWGYYRSGEPNAVVSAFAIQALADVEAISP